VVIMAVVKDRNRRRRPRSTLDSRGAASLYQNCLLSLLSPRYKDLWKRLPSLIFHSTNFQTYKKLTNFISNVLSLCDFSISLHALDFKRDVAHLTPHILKIIVDYAISHNVQWLGLFVAGDIAQIPPSMFSCHTLTHIKLCIYPK